MHSKEATTPRGNNSTGVEPNIDQGHNLNMAKKPTLDEMRLAVSKVMPSRQRKENLKKFLSPSKEKRVLYHATPSDFKEFQGEGFDPTISGNATWLSTDPHHQPAMHNISGGRDAQFREGTNVMPVHVQAKVPLYLDDKGMIEWARSAYANGSSEFPDLLSPNTVKMLKEDGFDSIIHADPYKVGRAHEIIMLDPRKIKSAIGNRGTYDVNEPDITMNKGGEVHNDAAFIGYLSPHGKFESYPESVAKANDYHHSHTVKDLDAYDAEGGLTFVRMGGEPIVSIKGTPAMDPFHHKHSPMVSDLARRIIASGGHPDMPIKVEDMGFKPHEAPYQNKHIGTLHEWSMRNVPKKAKGGITHAHHLEIEERPL